MNIAEIFKIANNFKNKLNTSNIHKSSNLTDVESVNRAFDKLANRDQQDLEDDEEFLMDYQPIESKHNEILLRDISLPEYRDALYSCKPDSAPGPDLINFKLIQYIPPNIHESIAKLFNNFFKSTKIPRAWTEYFVIFLPKPNSTEYRPISLASCFFKLYEKILQRRLEW